MEPALPLIYFIEKPKDEKIVVPRVRVFYFVAIRGIDSSESELDM